MADYRKSAGAISPSIGTPPLVAEASRENATSSVAIRPSRINLRYISDSSVTTTPLTNFAPRIGLAYQLTPKFVTRAGYGIFYGGFENVGGAPDPGYTYPYAVNLGFFRKNDVSPLVYPNGQRATLEAGLSAANPDPASPNFDAHGLGLLGFERPWKTAYTQQWNRSEEHTSELQSQMY